MIFIFVPHFYPKFSLCLAFNWTLEHNQRIINYTCIKYKNKI